VRALAFAEVVGVWDQQISREEQKGVENSADVTFMRAALEAAKVAGEHGDVPVGCVLEFNGDVIAIGENRREVDHDATAHAEIVALREASKNRQSWRMEDVTAYVTLEPCVMCAGALLNARCAAWSSAPSTRRPEPWGLATTF